MTVHTCLRCGATGPAVLMKLVDLEAEARLDGGRIREVEVVQEIAHRHIVEKVRHMVPERFAAEPRCRDRAACEQRLAGAGPMAATAPGRADEEDYPWQ